MLLRIYSIEKKLIRLPVYCENHQFIAVLIRWLTKDVGERDAFMWKVVEISRSHEDFPNRKQCGDSIVRYVTRVSLGARSPSSHTRGVKNKTFYVTTVFSGWREKEGVLPFSFILRYTTTPSQKGLPFCSPYSGNHFHNLVRQVILCFPLSLLPSI